MAVGTGSSRTCTLLKLVHRRICSNSTWCYWCDRLHLLWYFACTVSGHIPGRQHETCIRGLAIPGSAEFPIFTFHRHVKKRLFIVHFSFGSEPEARVFFISLWHDVINVSHSRCSNNVVGIPVKTLAFGMHTCTWALLEWQPQYQGVLLRLYLLMSSTFRSVHLRWHQMRHTLHLIE